jgi:hypothetical protein
MRRLLFPLALVGLLVSACVPLPPPDPSAQSQATLGVTATVALTPNATATGSGVSGSPAGTAVSGYENLLPGLRGAGVTVEEAGTVSQPFFPVDGQVIQVNGEDVQVFEFSDAAAAEAAAATVSPSGGSVGTTMVTWLAPPHFYRLDRLIVIHLGSDPAAAAALTLVLGPQFAGP